jgi:succinate dehydrogenase / fumarate reductase membrane anchor subunit
MVNPVSTLGRNGVQSFLFVRVTAVILTLYTLYMVLFFFTAAPISYEIWVVFFDQLTTQVFTLLALLALLIHAWIGLWQVFSDYVKSPLLRGALQLSVVVVLLVYFLSGVLVVWGGV